MIKCRAIFLVPTLLLSWMVGVCQVTDTIPPLQKVDFQRDTIVLSSEDTFVEMNSSTLNNKRRGFGYRLFKEDYPNPKKALFLSLAIPGGGQFYNRKYWKVPIVWAGYAALIYSAQFNGSNYRILRDAVIAEFDGELHRFSDTGLDVGDLQRLRDQYDKRKQLSYIGLFALHLVQTAEAFVDCHLKTFDVSEDLSLRVGPSFQASPQTKDLAPGVGISLIIR